MGQLLKIIKDDGAVGGWVSFLASIGLLVYSVICPPKGVIDSTVLAATGELLAFSVLFKLPNIIQSIKDGKSITYHHGQTDVTISSEHEENQQDSNVEHI